MEVAGQWNGLKLGGLSQSQNNLGVKFTLFVSFQNMCKGFLDRLLGADKYSSAKVSDSWQVPGRGRTAAAVPGQ